MTLDGNGNVVTTDDYYPFGLLERSGDPETSGQLPGRSYNIAQTGNRYKYSGKELDEEGGLDWYYFGARYYDAEIGRFLTLDRFKHLYPSMTPYQYAQNNPIIFIDVNGDSTKRTDRPDVFEETEPIVATATSDEPSLLNPLTWVSFLLFNEPNYYKPLFTGDGMEWIATFETNIIPGGGAAIGISAKIGKKILSVVAKKTLQKGLKKLSPKIIKQMSKRGWTKKQIIEALHTKGISAMGKDGPATRYVHPITGKSVVVDNKTGEIFHVGGEGFKY